MYCWKIQYSQVGSENTVDIGRFRKYSRHRSVQKIQYPQLGSIKTYFYVKKIYTVILFSQVSPKIRQEKNGIFGK